MFPVSLFSSNYIFPPDIFAKKTPFGDFQPGSSYAIAHFMLTLCSQLRSQDPPACLEGPVRPQIRAGQALPPLPPALAADLSLRPGTLSATTTLRRKIWSEQRVTLGFRREIVLVKRSNEFKFRIQCVN